MMTTNPPMLVNLIVANLLIMVNLVANFLIMANLMAMNLFYQNQKTENIYDQIMERIYPKYFAGNNIYLLQNM